MPKGVDVAYCGYVEGGAEMTTTGSVCRRNFTGNATGSVEMGLV
jgi:hypothetical protein